MLCLACLLNFVEQASWALLWGLGRLRYQKSEGGSMFSMARGLFPDSLTKICDLTNTPITHLYVWQFVQQEKVLKTFDFLWDLIFRKLTSKCFWYRENIKEKKQIHQIALQNFLLSLWLSTDYYNQRKLKLFVIS